jgi:transposase
MIPLPSGVRVWLATGHTDMRKGFASLSLLVQEVLRRDPLSGHLFCFRGRRGDLLKVIWHDGQGACLFTKRLERGRFIWPSPADGAVTISSAQLGYLLSASTLCTRSPQSCLAALGPRAPVSFRTHTAGKRTSSLGGCFGSYRVVGGLEPGSFIFRVVPLADMLWMAGTRLSRSHG